MTVMTGLEWPDAGLGPLCPGEWVEEIDPEDLPGEGFGAGEEWFDDAQDQLEIHGGWEGTAGVYGNPPNLEGADAVDEYLSEGLVEAQKVKCVQQATDVVARAFFRVRTQADLGEAFALLSHTTERHHIARAIIQMAVQRVVRLERKAYQAQVDGFRELNTKFLEAASECGWRLSPGAIPTAETLAPEKIRKQAWCAYQPAGWPSDNWKVGRGKELRHGATVAALDEQQLLAALQNMRV